MTDNWGRNRAEPVAVGPPRRRMTRSDRMREARGRRKRRFASGFALALLIVVVVGAVFLGSKLWHTMFGGGNDYSGDGVNDVVIQIHDGDSTTAIGKTLEDHKVVATVKAFVEAAEGNSAISAIQPGFYKVRTEIPASNAVARLADPQNRVGKLVIPEGRQLDDIRGRQDQRRHRRHLQPDLARDLCEPRRRPALRVGGRSAQGRGIR